jgi:hypothetical protein
MGGRRSHLRLVHLPARRVEHDRGETVPDDDDPWAGEDAVLAADELDAPSQLLPVDDEDEEDILAPARAILTGLVLAVPLWALILALGYVLVRVLD